MSCLIVIVSLDIVFSSFVWLMCYCCRGGSYYSRNQLLCDFLMYQWQWFMMCNEWWCVWTHHRFNTKLGKQYFFTPSNRSISCRLLMSGLRIVVLNLIELPNTTNQSFNVTLLRLIPNIICVLLLFISYLIEWICHNLSINSLCFWMCIKLWKINNNIWYTQPKKYLEFTILIQCNWM